MRTYTPRKFTPKMFRQGVVLLECPDCGVLVYERMTHDAWHAVAEENEDELWDLTRERR